MGSTVTSTTPYQEHVFGKKVQLLVGRSIGEEKVTDHILNPSSQTVWSTFPHQGGGGGSSSHCSRFGEVIPQFLDMKNRQDLTNKTQPLGVALHRYSIGDSLALFTRKFTSQVTNGGAYTH